MTSDINELLEKVIPPNDRNHREGFSNEGYIDELNESKRSLLEDALILKLSVQKGDTLIVETLAYLKSVKSLPLLYSLLNRFSFNKLDKLIVAASIYEINNDDSLIDFAIDRFRKVRNKYSIMVAFYYLAKFQSEKTNNVIGEYINNRDYLISYNAKRFLVK